MPSRIDESLTAKLLNLSHDKQKDLTISLPKVII